MIYVLNKEGKPLMPTERHGKVRRMLKNNEAKVVKREPFTIQLLNETTDYVQQITLGVDAGSKIVGLSATTKEKELYSGELELRNDITKLLAQRAEQRRSRRNRKTRYREPRFNNRIKSKKEGWLAPSIKNKVNSHLKVIENIMTLLPISEIIIEVATFDIQKIKNPNISGVGYQQGD